MAIFSQVVSLGNSRPGKARVADVVEHCPGLCHLLEEPGAEQKEEGVRAAHCSLCVYFQCRVDITSKTEIGQRPGSRESHSVD